MMPNTDPIVPQLRQKFEILIDYVSGSERATHDIYRVEVHLFRQLLTLGALLLRLFVRTRAGVRPAAPTTPDGVVMRYRGRRSVRYLSIFGELWVKRHYF